MFLYQLNTLEKMAFVQLAKEIVTVDDGKIDEYEYNLLTVMSNEMQIPVESALSIEFNIDQLAGKFQSDISKRICFAELYSLAIANNEYHEKQEIILDALIIRFGFNSNEVAQIKDWVQKALDLSNNGIKLMTKGVL
jgi:hypothetical protein